MLCKNSLCFFNVHDVKTLHYVVLCTFMSSKLLGTYVCSWCKKCNISSWCKNCILFVHDVKVLCLFMNHDVKLIVGSLCKMFSVPSWCKFLMLLMMLPTFFEEKDLGKVQRCYDWLGCYWWRRGNIIFFWARFLYGVPQW